MQFGHDAAGNSAQDHDRRLVRRAAVRARGVGPRRLAPAQAG